MLCTVVLHGTPTRGQGENRKRGGGEGGAWGAFQSAIKTLGRRGCALVGLVNAFFSQWMMLLIIIAKKENKNLIEEPNKQNMRNRDFVSIF